MGHSPDEPVVRLKLSPSAGEQENSDKYQYLGQRPYVTITVAFARNVKKLVQQSMQNYLSSLIVNERKSGVISIQFAISSWVKVKLKNT